MFKIAKHTREHTTGDIVLLGLLGVIALGLVAFLIFNVALQFPHAPTNALPTSTLTAPASHGPKTSSHKPSKPRSTPGATSVPTTAPQPSQGAPRASAGHSSSTNPGVIVIPPLPIVSVPRITLPPLPVPLPTVSLPTIKPILTLPPLPLPLPITLPVLVPIASSTPHV